MALAGHQIVQDEVRVWRFGMDDLVAVKETDLVLLDRLLQSCACVGWVDGRDKQLGVVLSIEYTCDLVPAIELQKLHGHDQEVFAYVPIRVPSLAALLKPPPPIRTVSLSPLSASCPS